MKPKYALCLAVDGLRASALGAYGNTWSPTPVCDALAADSIVCDRMLCDSPALARFYDAAWRGWHVVDQLATAPHNSTALPDLLRAAGVATTLIADDPTLQADLPDCDAVEGVLATPESPVFSADDVESTALYQSFASAAAEITATLADDRAAPPAGRMWWVHSRGLAGAWDAPASLREALWADEDLALPTWVASPDNVATDDPDELLAYRAAYAAQAAVFDECLGALLAAVRTSGVDDSLLIVLVGARGLALGEHGRVGAGVDQLYGERLHVPCLIRPPGDGAPRQRRGELVQPGALFATLCDWFEADAGGADAADRSLLRPPGDLAERSQLAAVGGAGEFAIVSDEWWLRVPPGGEAGEPAVPQLFAKPDDRWEANEVANLCRDEVAELLETAARWGLVKSDAGT